MSTLLKNPRIVIAIVAYNGERYIEKAIRSLLAQTFPDFTLLIVDDASTDRTPAIAERLAATDKRISFHRNPMRLGLVGNSQKAFSLAGDNIDYFAWAADHDIHDSFWLESLLAELENDSEVVMSYPLSTRIDENGMELNIPATRFECTETSVSERIEQFARCISGPGNMIYGLFRASTLRAIAVFPSFLFPDVVLVAQLCMLGKIKQVDKSLWMRRFNYVLKRNEIIARQLRTLFATPPWYLYFPWPVTHYLYLLGHYVLKQSDLTKRRNGLLLSRAYRQKFFPNIGDDYPTFSASVLDLERLAVAIESTFAEHLSDNDLGLALLDTLPLEKAPSEINTVDLPTAESLTKEAILKLINVFDEGRYIRENPDVAQAITEGVIRSAFSHYLYYGRSEGRAFPNKKD